MALCAQLFAPPMKSLRMFDTKFDPQDPDQPPPRAVDETAILLHHPLPSSRCLSIDGEGMPVV